jgi:3-oxoacyl-[acyl-carrier protein] reductase
VKVIVTGASRGIGRGIASYLALDGFSVGLLARSEADLADVAESIRVAGSDCVYASADVRRSEEIHAAIAELVDELGGVDAIVNNAGLVIRKSVWDLDDDEWDALLETNVSGLFHATRAVLPVFREQGSGHIVNISSISGRVPLPGGSAYAATKYAVTGFGQSLFQEVRDFGIRVTTVYPGSVDSASHRHESGADHSWKVTPGEVGRACAHVLRMPEGTVVSEYEIRPLSRPPKG